MGELQVYLSVVFIMYCIAYFFDSFFKSCCHYPYIVLMKKSGITIGLMNIQWFTTAFNRLIQKWGTVRPKCLATWYCIGSVVSIALMPVATILIIVRIGYSIKDFFQEDSNGEKSHFAGITFEPVIPGLNLPAQDIFHYIFSLLTCTIVHELGHAVAAAREGLHISGFGVQLLFIIPFAYTLLDQVDNLPPSKQLRVLCAGIWHNLILAVFAAFVVFAMPFIFAPVYSIGQSVHVEQILKDSLLIGPSGLEVGDEITKVNYCPVQDMNSWRDCLVQSTESLSPGYCVSSEFIHQHDESFEVKHLNDGTIDCCRSNMSRNLCFEYLESEFEPIELPQYSCLNVRNVVENFEKPCQTSQECEGLHCFRPMLTSPMKLIQIRRQNKPVILFRGHASEIFRSVGVSEYVPRYFMFPSWLPATISKFFSYLHVFSAGIAVVNVIPCFYFDGFHITRVLVHMIWQRSLPSSVRLAVTTCITILGSFILIIYLVLNLALLITR
ncbi:unnamed protein product [Bemisia tabaci]|uniref:Membrane-bound transcription factor site-2 protease n=1 Tax=Bemisia tabaci TaxID=7038 RepID=A0A9P0A696_BEMTA|nr:unnamed protein product [Bemisia tabaci]